MLHCNSNFGGNNPIYLDYNATTPLSDGVKAIIVETLEVWGNPSSDHLYGKLAKDIVDRSRRYVADMIGTTEDKVFFTSGGTEANTWIIWNTLFGDEGNIVASSVEHPSIKLTLEEYKEKKLIDVKYIKMNGGIIDLKDLEEKIDKKTKMVTVMLANNETGVIQPIKEMCEIVRKKEKEMGTKIIIHTDGAQIIGKCKVSINNLGVDCMTIVGHKFYAPKIGALVIAPNSDIKLNPMLVGGGQERNMRSGTENVPMIAGFGHGCLEVTQTIDNVNEHLLRLQKYFENKIYEALGDSITINFSPYDRIPNTSSVCFKRLKMPSTELLKVCRQFVASVGAACHSGNLDSCVMMACGMSERDAKRCVRFSFGKQTTFEELDVAIGNILENIPALV